MLEAYREHVAEREALGIPPKPLNAEQTAALVDLLKNPPAGEEDTLVYLLENRVPPGDYSVHHVRFVCTRGVPLAMDMTTLTGHQKRTERSRERMAMASTATEQGFCHKT